jgi:hypothetical protein
MSFAFYEVMLVLSNLCVVYSCMALVDWCIRREVS